MTVPLLVWIVYAFIVGATVGSFLNVCIWRIPRRCLSIFKPGRSFCPACQRTIAWYDNIPVLSYIHLGAKCRHCRAPISARYPLVEALTGALFAGFFILRIAHPPVPQWPLLAIHLALGSAILVASFIDWEFMIIPDRITKPGMVVAPILGLVTPVGLHGASLLTLPDIFPQALAGWIPARGLYTSLVGMAVGAGVIYGMGVVGKLLFLKEAMGLGDVKFMAMIGGVLGWKGVLVSLLLACVFGSVVGVARKLLTGDSYIPFGPFLGAGAIAMMVLGDRIVVWFDQRFGLLMERVASRMGSGPALLLILLAGVVATAALVWRSRQASGPPAGPEPPGE